MPSDNQLRQLYDVMTTARYYEERLQEEYKEGKQPVWDISAGPIPGELHLAAGHEAAAAGVCIHLRDDDTVTAPHRHHHIAIAKGLELRPLTAEIYGRIGGYSDGKGGHMHIFDPERNYVSSSIIAQGVPAAAGAALAAKKRNTDQVAVAFLGEGAIDQGAFLETLNFASVHDLPMVFVVEDNDWAISMPKSRITDVENGAVRAKGHDIPGTRVDSDDVLDVFDAAKTAVDRARDDNGPTVLEVQVHRRMPHFMGDAEAYRPDEDVEAALMRDSIERLESTMAEYGIEEGEREAIAERAHERVDEAIAWAREQPEPEPSAAYEDVFTNPPSGPSDTGSAVGEVPADE